MIRLFFTAAVTLAALGAASVWWALERARSGLPAPVSLHSVDAAPQGAPERRDPDAALAEAPGALGAALAAAPERAGAVLAEARPKAGAALRRAAEAVDPAPADPSPAAETPLVGEPERVIEERIAPPVAFAPETPPDPDPDSETEAGVGSALPPALDQDEWAQLIRRMLALHRRTRTAAR